MQYFRNRYMQYGDVSSFAIGSIILLKVFFYRLCIETPRTGSRLLQTADEDLLNLADERECRAFRSSTFLLIFLQSKYSCHRGVHQVRLPRCGTLSRLQPHTISARQKSGGHKSRREGIQGLYQRAQSPLCIRFNAEGSAKRIWRFVD
jgi:hypothetical protein